MYPNEVQLKFLIYVLTLLILIISGQPEMRYGCKVY